MKILYNMVIILLVLTCVSEASGRSPESSLTFSGSMGYAILSLKQVNEDHERDVASFNEEGIALPAFPTMHTFPVVSGSVIYRFGPYGAVTLHIVDFSMAVNTEYSDTANSVSLERTVGATDVIAGIQYFIPPFIEIGEWFVELEVGNTYARATAEASGMTTIKQGEATVTVPSIDEKVRYKKTKTFIAAGFGVNIPVLKPIVLTAKAKFKSAPVGQMDGKVTEFGETFQETSTTTFDYSGLFFSLGLGIEF
jgi:hypothetical protein